MNNLMPTFSAIKSSKYLIFAVTEKFIKQTVVLIKWFNKWNSLLQGPVTAV